MRAPNGDMWVVDAGTDIQPGDYLISSEVAGCAMRDDALRYPTGYIVARAAEPVRWGDVAKGHGAERRKRISVLFESFVRSSESAHTAGDIETLRSQVERQRRDIAALTTQLESLIRIVNRQVNREIVPPGLEHTARASR